MSVLDSFFSKTGFKAAKCKTLLKLAIPRIKLLRNRREIQIKQMRRDIANLLQNGQEATARIRVEHIIREENMMAAQEIIELFCELIVVRLPIIETQKECPLDLKEAISSICFAAPRCSDLPELQQVQMHFAAKYGREFVAAATELRPDCGVNRQVIELLSVRAPSVESKLKLLKEIAEEHEVDWDPAESEKELLKPHEDLLNGPNHLLGGSTGSPEGKDEDSLSSKHVVEQEFSSDEDIDYLDLPEVPKATVQPSPSPPVDHENFPSPDSHPTVQPTAPHIFSHAQSPHDSSDPNYENSKSISSHENPHQAPDLESKSDKQEEPSANASLPATAKEKSQFVPFVSSPSFPPSVSLKQDEQVSLKGSNQSKQITESSSVSKNDSSADLQDVIVAARAAADTAERAAAAARAAASLAQVRITELVSRRNSQTPEVMENELNGGPEPQNSKETHKLDTQISSGRLSGIPDNLPRTASGSLIFSSHDQSPEWNEGVTDSHQPQRSTSLDDDPYFSYPNLFTPQNSFRRS